MKNLIFDLDGTLLYTLEDLARACNAILKKYSLPERPLSEYNRMVGNGFDKLVSRALPKNSGISGELATAITAEARKYYAEHLYDATAPYPGVPAALEQLISAGATVSVLSNKPDPMTREIISHFFPNIPFAVVQGARPDIPLKPSPAPLLHIIEKFSWNPAECCYIGDSDVDIITGKAAGLHTAGVSWGFRGREELEKERPDFIFDTPGELLETLSQFHGAPEGH